MPNRIQLSRSKGWRLPPNAVKVDRTTRWGNPWKVCWARPTVHYAEHGGEMCRMTAADAVAAYRIAVLFPIVDQPKVPTPDEIRRELAGKDLACWCTTGRPCHADFLLLVAAGELP